MICKDCHNFYVDDYRYLKGHCMLNRSEKYFESTACDCFENKAELNDLTDEQLEKAIEAIKKTVDAITEAMVNFTEAFKESVNSIDWNAILEAMQEAQNNAGDNNNSDNMRNIGDDLMDQ